jgi:hypothetical protein
MNVATGVALASWLVLDISGSAAQLPLEPSRESGQSITAAYEGWFKNADGTFTLLLGYYNRNSKQVLDIPIGPDNRIEPGGPDRGQPTHFLPRRQWGIFTVAVPADFEKNTPPVLKFQAQGMPLQGPPRGISASYDAMVGAPLTLTVWASDDAIVDASRRTPEAPVTLSWSKIRANRQDRWQGHDHGDVQPGGGIHHPRAGQRRIWRGRRRISVLLDERARQGHGQTVTMRGAGVLGACSFRLQPEDQCRRLSSA